VILDDSSSNCLIQLTGVVASAEARELHTIATSAVKAAKPVVVSCSETERLDSSALQILWALASEVRANELPFRVENASPAVLAYAKLAGFSDIFA